MSARIPVLLVSALLRGDCEHLPRLEDLSGAGGDYTPIVERFGEPGLASWLQRVGHPPLAQAVTIGVAVVRAVAAVHRAGVVGVMPDASAVRFRADGCPVLCSFAALEPLSPTASPRNDWLATGTLLERLGLCGPRRPGSRGAGGLASAVAAVVAHESDATLASLEDALFAIAAPQPVALGSPSPAARPMPTGAGLQPLAPRPPERELSARLAEAFEAGPRAFAAPLLARLRRAASGRRRVVIVGGAIAAAAILGLLAVLPADDPPGASRAAPGATLEATAQPAATATAPAAADPLGAVAPVSGPGPTTSPVGDPVSAARGLFSGFDASLIERDGGTALVALQPTAGSKVRPETALLIETPQGWRIRRVFEG